jgi:hypothetical protein
MPEYRCTVAGAGAWAGHFSVLISRMALLCAPKPHRNKAVVKLRRHQLQGDHEPCRLAICCVPCVPSRCLR